MLAAAIACISLATPDVFLISIDTIRAEHFSCYGYEFPTTPNIDAIAERGILFDNMTCEVPLTGPSMGSMMASMPPRVTGAVRNGLPMPQDVPLVAEAFQRAGYQTVCVQSNWTLKGDMSGLHRGFDVYDEDFRKRRWGFLVAERDGKDVTKRALKLIENRDQDKPIFAWIHYSDPHAPYKWRRKFNVQDVSRRDLDKEEDFLARYDSEVAFTDDEIGKILDVIPEDAVIVIVGDHGESLFEHGYLGHGRRIHQTGMHVPFIVAGPGIDAKRVDAPVRGIDVGPTILGFAGLELPPTMQGINLAKELPADDRVRVIETYGGAAIVPGAKEAMAEADPLWQGVIAGPWKFMSDGGDTMLFHLEEDPGELENRIEAEPDRADAMRALIANWNTEFPRRDLDDKVLNDEDIEALENLGYL